VSPHGFGFGHLTLTFLSIIEVDEFIAELWRVHLKVKEEGYVQV
jgi:hypothetical protein